MKTKLIMQYQQGLGNQMFQYALHKSLENHGYDVKASLKLYSQSNQKFILPIVFKNIVLEETEEECRYIFQEPISSASYFLPNVFHIKNLDKCGVKGYWQSELYFKDIKEKIKQDFIFNIPEEQLIKLGIKFQNDKKPTVGMHIRRGDYLQYNEYQNICTDIYYERAIKYIKNKLGEDINFIVFSNDIKWCKEKYPNFTYIDTTLFNNYQDYYDMYLMSCCQHNIIANSSFSWWGAWLNSNANKIIIAPNKWLNTQSTLDIWCPEWIKISGK